MATESNDEPKDVYARSLTDAVLIRCFSCSRYDTNPAEVPDPENDEALVEAEVSESTEPTSADTDAKADTEPRRIVLAGGCFWCVEAVYEELEGVLDVESGYAGGLAETANYDAVKTGQTKHAEVVRITYDPSKITYGTILKVFFTTAHDPTTLNRPGCRRRPAVPLRHLLRER